MTKQFVKYLLPLSIILLIGFNQLFGYGHHATDRYAVSDCSHEASFAAICPVQHDQFYITKSSIPNTENERLLISATESELEEYELSFSKKYLESSTFFTAVFCILILGTFFHLKKSIAYWVPVSSFRSFRWYLQLRVIRV